MPTKYYLLIENQKRGPFLRDELIDAGMQRDTLVWFKGRPDWLPASDYPDLGDLLSDLPPPGRRRQDEDAPLDLRPRFSEAYLRRPYYFAVSMLVLTLGLIVLGAGLGFLALWIDREIVHDRSLQWIQTTSILAAIACGGIALLSLGVGGIFFLVVLYRVWAIIQDGHASATPGAAVGFLFIPVFQLYWVFVATLGLAKTLNQFADRHRLAAPRAPVMLGSALAVYYALGMIPVFGAGAIILNLLIAPLFLRSIYRSACCFCTENSVPLDNTEMGSRPDVTGMGIAAGSIALVLGFLGFSGLAVGAVFLPIQWSTHKELTRLLDHNRDRLAKLKAIPERDRGENVRRDIPMVQRTVDFYERFDLPRSETRLSAYSIALAVGGLCSAIATICAIAASISNSRLDST